MEAVSTPKLYAAKTMLPVTASTSGVYCMDKEQELDFIRLEVTNCEGVPTELACPCEGEGTINIQTNPLGTTLSSLVANNELPAGQLNNTCLAIAGRLIVDGNYSITGGQIRMQPGAEIVIPSGSQLTLQGINQNRGIHGCEQMWHAIRVLGTLNMSNCRVEDAAKAVQVEPSANFQQVTADITATTFNRNHIGVYLPPSTAGFFPYHIPNLNISGCVFETDYSVSGSLLPPANPLPPQSEVGPPVDEVSGYPNVQEIGYVGILTNDLGPMSGTINPNTFRNLLHGHVHNNTFASVRVENSTFDDVKGAGVYGLEARLEVYDNTMTNCGTYGVFSDRLNSGNTEVNGNNIDGANLGVYLLLCQSARNIDVLDNIISSFNFQGIIATYMENNFDVSRNIISGASDAESLRGIFVTGDGTTQDASNLNRFIVDNDISADYLSGGGVTMLSLPGTEIARNQVVSSITDNPYIYLSSSSNTIVADNYLEGGSADWLYGNGVNIVASPNVKASCNEVRNVSQPLSFSLDCGCTDITDPNTCTDIIGNRLYAPGNGENYQGLLLRQAMVSQQERTGNEWFGVTATDPANVHDATFIGDPFTVFASEFITHTSISPYYPQKINGPASWFRDEAGDFCDCESDCLDGGSGGVAFAEGVAQGEYYTNVAGAQWVAERHLYRQLAENTALHTNSTLDSFYLARQTHPIGAFYDAEQAIRNDLPLTSAEKAQLEQLQSDVDSLQAELASATGSHQASLERQLFYAQHQLQQYELELQLDRDNEINTIVADVQNINAQSTPAQNLQTALSITTRQKLSTVNSFTAAERTQLEAIAAQCVEQGGDGVLLARALLQWTKYTGALQH